MDEKGKILLALDPSRVPEGTAQRLAAAGEGRQVIIASGKDEIAPLLRDVEIAAGDFPVTLLPNAPALKWLQLWYAGADWLQKFPELAKLPITITTASGIHSEQMTEHLFGLLVAWNRKFPRAFAAQARKEWEKWQHSEMSTLWGKTMVIMGYGTIGPRIAAAAEVFGMTVIGVRRSEPKVAMDGGRRVVALARLDEVLPLADVVVNILPSTAETKLFCDGPFFASMKRGSLFANIGRGATVDEEALVNAIKGKIIAGAVLDVASEEPLPPSSPLWTTENLILTSHYSGFHPRYDEMALQVFLDNMTLYNGGQTMKNVVDTRLGY